MASARFIEKNIQQRGWQIETLITFIVFQERTRNTGSEGSRRRHREEERWVQMGMTESGDVQRENIREKLRLSLPPLLSSHHSCLLQHNLEIWSANVISIHSPVRGEFNTPQMICGCMRWNSVTVWIIAMAPLYKCCGCYQVSYETFHMDWESLCVY